MTSPAAVLAVLRAARPAFISKASKLAFALHAGMLASGYRLLACGPAAEADPATAAEVPDAAAAAQEEVGHEGWDGSAAEGRFAFRYAAEDGSCIVALKALVLGDALMVDLASGNGPSQHLELRQAPLNPPIRVQ